MVPGVISGRGACEGVDGRGERTYRDKAAVLSTAIEIKPPVPSMSGTCLPEVGGAKFKY